MAEVYTAIAFYYHNKAELHRDLQEVEEWRALSLEQAMRGLDDDNLPEYTEADLVEKWQ